MATAPEHLPAVRVMLVSEPSPALARWASTTEDCIAIGRELIGDADREHLIALLVDGRLRMVAVHTVGIGGRASAPCDVAGLFRAAMLAAAAGFVLVHNHPSGAPAFSDDDRDLWARVSEAGELLGVKALDCIVVTPGRGPALSMANAGAVFGDRQRGPRPASPQDAVEREFRRRIRQRTEAERAAFVAAVTSGAAPGDLAYQDGPRGSALTFRGLTRLFCSAGLPLPEPARLALTLPAGATFASAARHLLKRWKTEGLNHEPRDGGSPQA
ncbi:MAG: hypothetical protein EPN53_00965 [Acidobacteria bacterium]|nr:MAG: hypothetical protein EPN53_00965 [Acidobacteriota bacterium]